MRRIARETLVATFGPAIVDTAEAVGRAYVQHGRYLVWEAAMAPECLQTLCEPDATAWIVLADEEPIVHPIWLEAIDAYHRPLFLQLNGFVLYLGSAPRSLTIQSTTP